MPAHLATDPALLPPRPRLAGANYRGTHRAHSVGIDRPGALVLEPGSQVLSSVIRLVDPRTALVRHVGTFDDHLAPLSALVPASTQLRIGADFGDVD